MDNILDTIGLNSMSYLPADPSNIPLAEYNPGNGSGLPRFRIDKDGNLILYISTTMIKTFFTKGLLKEYCPQYVYHKRIINSFESDSPTPVQLNGLYFETKCFGKSAGNRKFDELPRINKGIKKSVDNLRIDEQILMFKQLTIDRNFVVDKEMRNVQLFIKGKYPNTIYQDVTVILTAELDYLGPFKDNGVFYPTAVVDLKLTKDVDSEWGDFCWGKPEFMDHTQATFISYMTKFPFFYWIFDYKPSGRSNRVIQINHDVNHIDPVVANKAKFRLNQLHEDIRKTVVEIVTNFKTGWERRPVIENCKKCNLDCELKKTTQLL